MQQLLTYKEALQCALEITERVSKVETVPLQQSVGRMLASDIIADRDFPPFHRSQMDGYAVLASEVAQGVSMQVLAQVAAGTTFVGEHAPLTCVAIATGAPVPDCFDAVVPHERTDRGDETVVFECCDIPIGACIHPKGVDAKSGDVLLQSGTTLSPQHIGLSASAGVYEIPCCTKPRVIVITSGDEIVSPQEKPLPHQIRNGNNSMIRTALQSMGCNVVEFHHVQDDAAATNSCIANALDGRAELVVTVGGISVGKRDYFPAAFEKSQVQLTVKGANIQPGKPIIVGKHANAIVLGLPGNPVSALVCCTVFGWPIIRTLQGVSATLPWQNAILECDIQPNPSRLAFRPCVCSDGELAIPRWQGSGDLVHTATTDGLVQLPSSEETIQAGSQVTWLRWPWS